MIERERERERRVEVSKEKGWILKYSEINMEHVHSNTEKETIFISKFNLRQKHLLFLIENKAK